MPEQSDPVMPGLPTPDDTLIEDPVVTPGTVEDSPGTAPVEDTICPGCGELVCECE